MTDKQVERKEAATFPKEPKKALSIAFEFGNNGTAMDNPNHLKIIPQPEEMTKEGTQMNFPPSYFTTFAAVYTTTPLHACSSASVDIIEKPRLNSFKHILNSKNEAITISVWDLNTDTLSLLLKRKKASYGKNAVLLRKNLRLFLTPWCS